MNPVFGENILKKKPFKFFLHHSILYFWRVSEKRYIELGPEVCYWTFLCISTAAGLPLKLNENGKTFEQAKNDFADEDKLKKYFLVKKSIK